MKRDETFAPPISEIAKGIPPVVQRLDGNLANLAPQPELLDESGLVAGAAPVLQTDPGNTLAGVPTSRYSSLDPTGTIGGRRVSSDWAVVNFTVTGTMTDVVVPGMTTNTIVNLFAPPPLPRTLTGISGGALGRRVILRGDPTPAISYPVDVAHNSASSLAANRIFLLGQTDELIGTGATQSAMQLELLYIENADGSAGWYEVSRQDKADYFDTWGYTTLAGGPSTAADDGNVVHLDGAETVTGAKTFSGGLLSSAVAQTRFGYAQGAGAGAAVTQGSTSGKATAVTIDKPTGHITTNAAALAAGANVAFSVNNASVTIWDTIQVNYTHGHVYQVTASAEEYNANGGFLVRIKNISAGSLSEAIGITFTVLSGSQT